VSPHKINYRANIAALKKLGVTDYSLCCGWLHPPQWPADTRFCSINSLCTNARAKTSATSEQSILM